MTHKFIVLSAAALLVAAGPATAQDSVPPPTPVQAGAPTTPSSEATTQPPEESDRSKRGARSKGRRSRLRKSQRRRPTTGASAGPTVPRCGLAAARASTSASASRVISITRQPRWTAMTATARMWTSRAGGSVWMARSSTSSTIRSKVSSAMTATPGVMSTPITSRYRVRAGAGWSLQAAVQPRREHQCHQPGLRVSLACGSLLAPGRDWGVMAHGRCFAAGGCDTSGLFREDGDNARTFNTDRVHGGQTVAGRAVVQPFRETKSFASDLAFGASFTTSEIPEGVSDLRGRTELDAPFYRPAVLVNGQRHRLGFEARFRPGPFSIKSEYIRLSDERRLQSVDNTDLDPFVLLGGTSVEPGRSRANRKPRDWTTRAVHSFAEDSAPSNLPCVPSASDSAPARSILWRPTRRVPRSFSATAIAPTRSA